MNGFWLAGRLGDGISTGNLSPLFSSLPLGENMGKRGVKGMIFILNPNPISIRFQRSWSFNIVSEPGLVGGHWSEPRVCNLFSIC